jgi:urease alpha subunit
LIVWREVISCEGKIVTPGGIDSHIHFICPQQVGEAIASGITTMLGGGTGPATGTNATTCTPGAWHIGRMLQAAEGLAVNLGFFAKGNASRPEGLREPTLLFSFAGWADAAESATHALRYMVRHLNGEKFAEVDPEEFYNFTRCPM